VGVGLPRNKPHNPIGIPAVRLMRRLTKWDVMPVENFKKNALQSQIRKGDGMFRLGATIENSPVITICFLCVVGLSISLAMLRAYRYSPEAWF
jgi:hypothetical protein